MGEKDFIFSIPAQTSPQAQPASSTIGTRVLFLGTKQPGHSNDHLPSYIKMSRAMNPLPISTCMACYGVSFIVQFIQVNIFLISPIHNGPKQDML
jgi:hypothetical protein